MSLNLIVAMDKNGCIGSNNDLPWPRLKKDMRHFRKLTKNHAVLMGRNTYDSIGRPLKNRHNIVISRKYRNKENTSNLQYFDNPESALEYAYDCDPDPFIIGGAKIYEYFLPRCDILWLTEVQAEFPGDTFFPSLNNADWKETKIEEKVDNEITLIFRKLERIVDVKEAKMGKESR